MNAVSAMNRLGLALILACGLSMAATPLCRAQAQGEVSAFVGGPGDTETSAVDVDFNGGTAVEFLDAIRAAAGGKVNIVAMPHVGEVMIPAMKLRSVDAIAAIRLLSGEGIQTPGRVVRLDVEIVAPPRLNKAALVKVNADVKEAGGYVGPQRSNIWSVADLINGGMSPDNIVTAVSAALELLGPDSSKAQVRFHKETSLLLARATVEQIEIINSVISELRASSAQQRAQSMKPIQERVAQLERELAESRSMLQSREVEASDRLQIAEMSRARAEAMERHAAELEAMTSKLRDELMQRESQIRALQIELDEMRAQLQKSRGGGGG
ncbi:MAG: hypothetical protein IT430_16220 [Phycisphaerales bacterium]|nr:hypothetical protein [Phycisphaerales bacterium]